MITPKQVSETLDIAPSTLRRWAKRFSDHLSPHEKGKHRSYTPSDLTTFQNIKTLLDQNLTYDEIENKLDVLPAPQTNQTSALLNLADFTQIMEEISANNQILRSQIEKQTERLNKLEEYITLPWYKKLFTKPPKGA
jgi:DNA-binding transcriptional MerR regulator